MNNRRKTIYLSQKQVDDENLLGEVRKKYKGLSGFVQAQLEKYNTQIVKKGGDKK